MTDLKPDKSLILVGCGNMGRAMLGAWQKHKVFTDIHIVDPHLEIPPESMHLHRTPETLPEKADVIVLAVKPQIMDDVLPGYRPYVTKNGALFLSVAAGKSLSFYERVLSKNLRLIRVMPNLPATAGYGMTGYIPNKNTTFDDIAFTDQLLSYFGQIIQVRTEDELNILTAVAGSGPGYVFHMIEALSTAAVHMDKNKGLSRLMTETISAATERARALAREDKS